jgi:DnaJ-class molecular chaperone
MSNVATAGNLCPKCGSELRLSWCAQCFGTGRSGKHKCKACGGKGTTTACPNVRSHKPKLFQIWTTFTQAAR